MNKEEFIARYGEEAYEERKKKSREYHRKNDATKKEDMIAKFGQEWYENRKRKSRELNAERREEEDIEHREKRLSRLKEYSISYSKTYFSEPIHRLRSLLRTRKGCNRVVSPDEAMILLTKKAEEAGCPELLNMNYMMERFHNNCKYGLVYGNLEILKYFYRLMQIKAAKNESFTKNDKELLHYFRNWEVNVDIPGELFLNNNWVIDVANLDMAYVEDMIRNTRGMDLLLTEEKYLEMKGLTNNT